MCLVSRLCTTLDPRGEAVYHLDKLRTHLQENCRKHYDFNFGGLIFFKAQKTNKQTISFRFPQKRFWRISIWFRPKYQSWDLTIHITMLRWIWITIIALAFVIHICFIVTHNVCSGPSRFRNIFPIQNRCFFLIEINVCYFHLQWTGDFNRWQLSLSFGLNIMISTMLKILQYRVIRWY